MWSDATSDACTVSYVLVSVKLYRSQIAEFARQRWPTHIQGDGMSFPCSARRRGSPKSRRIRVRRRYLSTQCAQPRPTRSSTRPVVQPARRLVLSAHVQVYLGIVSYFLQSCGSAAIASQATATCTGTNHRPAAHTEITSKLFATERASSYYPL